MHPQDSRSLLRRFGPAALLFGAALLLTGFIAPTAAAQGYVQLQVLLPGETAAPGTASGKVGTPIDQTVGTPFSVVVRATDANWNTISSVNNTIALSSTDAGATLPAPFGLVNGERTVNVTISASGSYSYTAQDQIDGTIPTATSASVTGLFLQGFEFNRVNQKNQYAGTPMAITVTAVDPSGGKVSGFNGFVELQELTSFGIGRIEPSSIQLSNGEWSGSVTMYRADETSINRGNVNIYAFWPTDPSRNGTSDPFTVHPGAFSRLQLIVPGQTALPGSVAGLTGSPASHGADDPFTIDVYATDDYWNPLPSSDVVRVISSDGAATLPPNAALNNGFGQFTVALGTVGVQTLTVSDQTNGAIQGMTSAGIPVITGTVDHFEIDPIVGPITAGAPTAVTIRATDSGNNTITDYNGDAIVTANTGPNSISVSAITFSAGVWSGDIEFRGAGGAVTLSVADYSSPPHTGTSASFEVVPGPFVGLQVVLPGETPAGGTDDGISGVPDSQASGAAFDVTVRAVDQYFNRVTGVSDQIQLSSSDHFATVPGPTALVNGILTVSVTLFEAGYQSITATDLDNGAIAAGTSNNFEVTAGVYSRIVLVAPGEFLAPGQPEGRSGAATDQSINYAFTVSVFATDQWGNPVVGITDTINLTSNDPLAELPADAAMVDGRVDMSLRLSTGGFQQITATNVTTPAMGSSTTQVRAIESGLHLEASVSSNAVAAGESFDLWVRVTNDAGAVIQEINSFVSVEVRNASTQAPGQGILSNTSFQLLQGQHTESVDYTFAEDIVLVITDDLGTQPAITGVVSVSPGAPASIVLSSNPDWVRGNATSTVTAQLIDAYGNGVPDEPMAFALLVGAATLTPIDNLTNGQGIALAEFQAPRAPEVGRIRAISGAITQELDIETALVDPNAKGGYLSNYPNPFHPGENPTTIAYKLNDNATVHIRIYTLTGGLVFETEIPAGSSGGIAGLNEFVWDGRNGNGELVASGGYILFVEAEGGGETMHTMRRKIGVVR